MNYSTLTPENIEEILEITDKSKLKELYDYAYKIKLQNVGNTVYFRGIVEFSNICIKNCLYCGIRRDNKNAERYEMSDDEVLKACRWAYEQGYGSIVLQSGERTDQDFINKIERLLKEIMKLSNNQLGVTLSLGEQTKETYKLWQKAGASRYLLRIETSNPELYKSLHPEDHNFNKRLQCIYDLRETGYQVGTGVMIGLPGQTAKDLVNDILFFKKHDIDMIGMGPYIVHEDTPLAEKVQNFNKDEQLELGLKMIALTRIHLKDVNIASTTALQSLNPVGREMGLQAGANVIMPNITDTKYRSYYQLYKDKPCLDENASQCVSCLENRIKSIGENIGYNKLGDSPHYKKRAASESK